MAKLTPLADKVVVKPLDREEVTASGIVLPDTAREKTQEGEILAVGPGRLTDDGVRLEPEVAVGDKVIYSKFGGTDYKVDDEELLILNERDILAKIG